MACSMNADQDHPEEANVTPRGLSAGAGSLADWDDLADVVEEIYVSRERAMDRCVPFIDEPTND